jgi:hypothetical protein
MWQNELLSEKNVFTAGLSRDKYVCPRALTSHPRPTRSTTVIAATDTTHFDNVRAVGGRHIEKSEVGGRFSGHFLRGNSNKV